MAARNAPDGVAWCHVRWGWWWVREGGVPLRPPSWRGHVVRTAPPRHTCPASGRALPGRSGCGLYQDAGVPTAAHGSPALAGRRTPLRYTAHVLASRSLLVEVGPQLPGTPSSIDRYMLHIHMRVTVSVDTTSMFRTSLLERHGSRREQLARPISVVPFRPSYQ